MNLENLNVQEMSTNEMKNTDGGFVFVLLAIGAALLLGGCAASKPVMSGHSEDCSCERCGG